MAVGTNHVSLAAALGKRGTTNIVTFFVTSFSKVPMASWVQSPVPAVLVRLPGLSQPQKQQPVVRVSAGAWVLLGPPGSCTASLTGTRLRCTRRHKVFEGTKMYFYFPADISLYLSVSLTLLVRLSPSPLKSLMVPPGHKASCLCLSLSSCRNL